MPPPCPQCRGYEWALVHFCLGCAQKVKGPVTLVMHQCPTAAPGEPAAAAPPPPPAPEAPCAAAEPALSAFPC